MLEPEETISTRQLYPYQEEAVNTIFSKLKDAKPNENILFQLPTGGGKTIIYTVIKLEETKQATKSEFTVLRPEIQLYDINYPMVQWTRKFHCNLCAVLNYLSDGE